jgi:hypothetical protein
MFHVHNNMVIKYVYMYLPPTYDHLEEVAMKGPTL